MRSYEFFLSLTHSLPPPLFIFPCPIPHAQLPVIYQNKVREDIIKLFMKAVNCRGLHSTLQLPITRLKVRMLYTMPNAQLPNPQFPNFTLTS